MEWHFQVKIIFCFATPMCHSYSHKLVHSHLLPNNIIFNTESNPKLVDFRYARLVVDSAHLSMKSNDKTIEYVAPEFLDAIEFTFDIEVSSLVCHSLVTFQVSKI
jgi:serine/threonine protein kinase